MTAENPTLEDFGFNTQELLAEQCKETMGKLISAEKEIERLRAALKQIKGRGDDLPGTSRNDYDAGYKAGTEQCAFIAETVIDEQLATGESND